MKMETGASAFKLSVQNKKISFYLNRVFDVVFK